MWCEMFNLIKNELIQHHKSNTTPKDLHCLYLPELTDMKMTQQHSLCQNCLNAQRKKSKKTFSCRFQSLLKDRFLARVKEKRLSICVPQMLELFHIRKGSCFSVYLQYDCHNSTTKQNRCRDHSISLVCSRNNKVNRTLSWFKNSQLLSAICHAHP